MEVVENRNASSSPGGNGKVPQPVSLVDSPPPSEGETEPLRKKHPEGPEDPGKKEKESSSPSKGLLSSLRKKKKPPPGSSSMKPVKEEEGEDAEETQRSSDPEDPGPSVSESEGEEDIKKGRNRRRNNNNRRDILGLWAHRCKLTPKKGLLYLIVCGAAIFLLLFILLILAVLWPKGHDYDPCNKSRCHQFSAQVIGSINDTIGPCDSFWEYSCGNWIKSNPIPKSKAYWDAKKKNELQVKEKIRNLLNTLPISELEQKESNSVLLKMKTFYSSCMEVNYIDVEGDKHLHRIVKSLGGWHLLRDFKINEFDFPRLLRKVHGEYRASPFFHITVVPDPDSPSRNVIMITPSGLSLPHPSYYFDNGPFANGRVDLANIDCAIRCREILAQEEQEIALQRKTMANAFQMFAKDVAQLLGANSYNAQQFATEVLNFERRIAEITPDPLNLTDPIINLRKLTVWDLKSMSNTIFWSDLLKSIFPPGTINDQTKVVTPSVQYLTDISGIISTTDKQNLNNYLMWHLSQKFLPYLSRPYTEALEMFRKETIGSNGPPPRWEFCVTEVLRFYTHVVDLLLSSERKEILKQGDLAVPRISEVFQTLKSTAMNRVNQASLKYDEQLRHFLIEKLRLMTVQIGNPMGNSSVLKEMYFSVQMQTNDFFPNVQLLMDFEALLEKRQLSNPTREGILLQTLSSDPFAIQFIPSQNKVVVPQTFLERDVLEVPEELKAILYGSVGVEIAEAIASAFGPEKGFYLAKGALLPSQDVKIETLRAMINSKRTCLSSFFTNIRLDDEPYIERTSLDTTIHLAAIQIALETVEDLEDVQELKSLPGLESYSPSATFFLSYAQSQCSQQTMQFHDLEHSIFRSLSHEHRVRGLLRQMVPFSDAFQCSKSSEMYADFTCGRVI